ncbi:MAG TPA: DUF2165 domain-containing protein [Chitinophagaceae bacterium]
MPSTSFLLRVTKVLLVTIIGLMAVIIAIGNVTDFYTNYYFVEHVMKMDTIFPASHVHYRSIHSHFIYNAGYILIILMEAMMAFLCLKGSWQLFQNVRSDAAVFQASKNWAVAGIVTGILIWFLGFEVIGGEWFSMWQSSTWNGLAAAERVVSFLFFVLILLHLRDE